jgi:hypothetical protein
MAMAVALAMGLTPAPALALALAIEWDAGNGSDGGFDWWNPSCWGMKYIFVKVDSKVALFL